MLAIFDTNAGFLQWIGEAKDHEAAIKALHDDVGLYESSANREDVLKCAGEDSLLLIDVTDAQAAALREWADNGFRGSSYPEGLDGGVVYSRGEVLEFMDSWDNEKKPPISEDKIRSVLAKENEGFNPEKTGYYESVEALVDKVRGTKNWSQGEVFVYAESEDKFVIMKQIAPASCEMLTITQDGYKDVLTAYRIERDELVSMLKDYMEIGSEVDCFQAAQKLAEQKETVTIADPDQGKTYSGKVLGVTDHHVVVSLGRSALIIEKRDIDRIPAVEENVTLKFENGKGVFQPPKSLDMGR